MIKIPEYFKLFWVIEESVTGGDTSLYNLGAVRSLPLISALSIILLVITVESAPPGGVTDSNLLAYKFDGLFASLMLFSSILCTIYLPSVKRKLSIFSLVITLPSGWVIFVVTFSGV